MKVLIVGEDPMISNSLARSLAIAATLGIGGLIVAGNPREIPPSIEMLNEIETRGLDAAERAKKRRRTRPRWSPGMKKQRKNR